MTAFASLTPQVQALFPSFVASHYEIHEWRNAASIFCMVHPGEWNELMAVLQRFRLLKSYIVNPGGNKSKVAIFFDSELGKYGWKEVEFDTEVNVDEKASGTVVQQRTYDVPTHKVDCYKETIALEIEWNNKDPFFDRDLNNFRLLFELRTVEIGVIITRADSLQSIFNTLKRGTSYGASTTHMSKLLPKIDGGGAGGCPILVFGIRDTLFVDDNPVLTPDEQEAAELVEKAEALIGDDDE